MRADSGTLWTLVLAVGFAGVPGTPEPAFAATGRGMWQALPAVKPLATAPATALGSPAGDGTALLVPFVGEAPDYAVHVHRGNPRWLYFEFVGCEIAADGSRFGVCEDPSIAAWMYTVPGPGRVRLYLRLRRQSPVVAQVLEGDGLIRFAAGKGRLALPLGRLAPRRLPAVIAPVPEARAPEAPREPEEPTFPADPVVPPVVPPGGEEAP